ncbi:hypothetical protein [Clostridium botulinum]|uniref:hypothetical protein n=1 Tax=Clostridium botulinum TaxID=1491 RepID=UPI000772DDC6|nr:hypothetical protein [Clostridium botulinum]
MSLLEKGLYRMFNGKRTINSTIFLKEFEEENTQLKELIELSQKVSGECKEKIDKYGNHILEIVKRYNTI